jgi:hypothetical protein
MSAILAAHQAHMVAWGDVPTWIAVIGALVGAGVALRQLRAQQREIARQTRILERQQADEVDVLMYTGLGAPPGTPSPSEPGTPKVLHGQRPQRLAAAD